RWLGASVAIAEIDETASDAAARRLAGESPGLDVISVPTDVADGASVRRLIDRVTSKFGPVDIVLNNATFAPVGLSVAEAPIADWDRSFAVNLRGPVLLARACLPSMLLGRHGIIVCVSSTGGPYLGAYECLKAAQVALGNTLDAELAGTGVTAFTIGPGLVPTATASSAVERLAPLLGMSLGEFYALNRGTLLSVEAAGAGFAAAIAMAERYAGQEISSSQALIDAGIAIPDELPLPEGIALEAAVAATEAAFAPEPATFAADDARRQCQTVRATLEQQAAGWQSRSFFERQWMLRDFKQRAGMPAERWLESLDRLGVHLAAGVRPTASSVPPLDRLSGFYGHMADLAGGYVKDPVERERQVAIVLGWQAEVEDLRKALAV
ncbi:MAG TPA: SDR family oxidoreductase, partial [Candidatus Limnocylindrales bacterium]